MQSILSGKSGGKLRILQVEGSVADADVIELELRAQGYWPDLTRVETLAAFEAALDARPYDLVLSDHAPPRVDAVAALRVIAARKLDIPFIIVSHTISEAVAIEVMHQGAHDYLYKHSLERLGAVIARETREAALREDGRRLQQQLLLADRLSSVGVLAAGVAHEINNPLAYVLGNLDFALAHLQRLDPAQREQLKDVEQSLAQAREGSERIRTTTRDLRVFCRHDEPGLKPVDVERVMESTINMAWSEIRRKARLVRQYEPVPAISGNENRLGQVFLNLLVNAAQALPEVQSEQSEITVSLRARDGYVIVEVRDTGCGIAPDQLKRVFEPFFTTKPAGVGSGIGLPICHSIVTELGGRIGVRSKLGEGTAFRVVLPACEDDARSSPPVGQSASAPRSHILVVDDEPALCAVMKRLLSPHHEVITVLGGREALDALHRQPNVDVIFCDIMMPGMSGMDLYAALDEVLRARMVFLTGAANGHARPFLSGVPNRVIEKPFEPSALHAAIAQVLEAHPRSGTWLMRAVQQVG